MTPAVLSAAESNQLGRLALAPLRMPAPAAAGLTRIAAAGTGLEFHDYRRYVTGDDPRRIDWNVAARHGQLVVRRFSAEGHTPLHLLLDVSGSMAIGAPSKLSCATKLGAALAYVASTRRDHLALTTFDATLRSIVPMKSGRAQLHRVLHGLGAADARGASSLDRALMLFGATAHGPGFVVILSDFFAPDLTLDGARFLLYRGLTPALVQVVADEEIEPDVADDLDLVDVEHPAGPPIAVDPAAIADYRRRLAALEAELRGFCAAHHLPWLRVPSSTPFHALITASVGAGLFSAC